MNYQALGNNVILNIPRQCLYMTGGKDQPEIKKPRVDAVGVPLTVLSIGQNVTNVSEGDQVLLFGDSVTIITLDNQEVIMIKDYEIDVKIKKEEKDILQEEFNRVHQNVVNQLLEGNDFDIDSRPMELQGIVNLDSDNLIDK